MKTTLRIHLIILTVKYLLYLFTILQLMLYFKKKSGNKLRHILRRSGYFLVKMENICIVFIVRTAPYVHF